jgi:hypothetical protein
MNNLNPHSEKKGTSAVRGWDVPLSAKEQRRLENEKRLQTNTENFKRYNLKPEPSTPDKTLEQVANEEESAKQYNRLHEEHMALMFERLSAFDSQPKDQVSDDRRDNVIDYGEELEKFKAEIRQTLKSEPSHVDSPGAQNFGVISEPDSSESKKKSDLFDQSFDASKRQRNRQETQDDFDVVYGSPNGQSPEALNRQFNSPQIIRALDTLNRWRDRLETTWVPDIMERAKQFSRLDNDQLKQRGVQDPDKYRKEQEKLERYMENSRAGQTVSVFDWEKSCSYLHRELRKLEEKADSKQAKL